MPNGDRPFIPIEPSPLFPAPRFPPRPDIPERIFDPPEAFQPPAVPIPGIGTPTPVFIPPAPATTAPSFGSLAARFGLPTAIGAIAVELLERVLGELQAREFREFERDIEAEIDMIRGRIEAKERIRRVEVQAAGDLAIPPIRRTPGLSDIPQFPFPDPFESPLGDDPLPPQVLPPGAVIGRLPETPLEIPPAPAPLPELPAPVRLPAPTLPAGVPQPAPAPAPKAPPAPSTRPTPSPFPSPAPPLPLPAPRRVPFFVGLPLPAPSTRPSARPKTPPKLRPIPIDPVVPLTTPRPVSVPSQLARPSNCPPCPRKKRDEPEEPRTECFKKLVKEARFPSQDESFDWVEISCETGKELR